MPGLEADGNVTLLSVLLAALLGGLLWGCMLIVLELTLGSRYCESPQLQVCLGAEYITDVWTPGWCCKTMWQALSVNNPHLRLV